jgi:ubiquinone/menaquinone biosynthesis C-methylase UbiE
LDTGHKYFVDNVFAILHDFYHKPNFDEIILDLGCGLGQVVAILHQKGYKNTIGVDISSERIECAQRNLSTGNPECFRTITLSPYSLPIDDSSLDFVFSSQVLEHVEDLSPVFSELSRTMKPNAVSVHIFPPKFRLIETHTNIPFGNILKLVWWHYLWISLGLRRKSMQDLSSLQCAKAHIDWMRKYTFYRLEEEIIATANSNGLRAYFINGLVYSRRFKAIQSLASFRLAKFFYGTFISKVLILIPDNK